MEHKTDITPLGGQDYMVTCTCGLAVKAKSKLDADRQADAHKQGERLKGAK